MIAQGRSNDASVCDPALPPDSFSSKISGKKNRGRNFERGGRGGERGGGGGVAGEQHQPQGCPAWKTISPTRYKAATIR